MKKILCLALFACLLFPTLGHAGVQGTYNLDKKAMFAQFMKLINKRKVPPQMRKMIVAKMRAQMNSRKMWMVLSGKDKFEGVTQKKGAKAPRVGAKGTWKVNKDVLTIDAIDTRRKRPSKMVCKIGKKRLACKDSRNPKLVIYFTKK